MLSKRRKLLYLVTVTVCGLVLQDQLITLLDTNHTSSGDPEHRILDHKLRRIRRKQCDVVNNQVPFVNVTEPCDVAEFIKELNDVISGHSEHVPLALLRGCEHVFYNRVPKCGSRSLYETFLKMGEKHGYAVLKKAMGLGRDPTSRLYKIDPFIRMMENMSGRYITAKHLYFIDMLGLSKKPIIMINVLREPLEQLISVYSWRRFGDDTGASTGPSSSNSTVSLDDCISIHGVSNTCFNWHMMAFPFLCEHTAGCWERQAPGVEQLQRAKWHVDNSFLLVGVTEDIPAFLAALETLLPQYFCGMMDLYNKNAEDYLTLYKSKKKEIISAATEEILKTNLSYHYELYYHARQRFYRIHQALHTYL